jgi:nucleoside phosphorylase
MYQPIKNVTNYILCIFLTIFITSPIEAKTISRSPLKKILLVVAMDSEAQPFITTLNLHKLPHSFSKLPMQAYSGKYENLNILLMTNGEDPIHKVQNVGTQAAALSTYLGINYFHPDLVISIGTAGGVEANDAKEKDIYLSHKIYFYDRRLPLKGYDEYGLGAYPSADVSTLVDNVGFKQGIVCSGDSFDENPMDYDIFVKEKCSAIDMEAAGVAWVSMLMNIPMIAIKGVTNYVRGDGIHIQYEKNLPDVTKDLSTKLKELLKNLSATATAA